MGTTSLNTARAGLACSLIRSGLKYRAPRPEQATPPRVHASTGQSAPRGLAKAEKINCRGRDGHCSPPRTDPGVRW
jgi:hypothetical protein